MSRTTDRKLLKDMIRHLRNMTSGVVQGACDEDINELDFHLMLWAQTVNTERSRRLLNASRNSHQTSEKQS